MGRVINIDELWKELEILYDAKNGEVSWNDALWKIKSAPIVESDVQQWIPCSETVDIPEHEVLCCDKYGEELIGWLSCEDDQWLCESEVEIMYAPVAWMEKPKPWKGEQE